MVGEDGEGVSVLLNSVLQLRWDMKLGVELGNSIHDFVK
jgi:hypothetical protein